MNKIEYIRQIDARQSIRQAICAQEARLLDLGKAMLDEIERIDPYAMNQMLDVIGAVAGRNPLQEAA